MGSSPAQQIALMAIGLSLVIGAVIVFRRMPRTAVATWVGAMFFTPVWLGATIMGFNITALVAVTLLAIVSWTIGGLAWTLVDTLVSVLAASVALAVVIGGADVNHAQEVVLMWLVPYVWGRIVLARVPPSWLAICIAVAAGVVSVLGILEFFTAENIFLLVPGAESSVWSELRVRAGLPRVEGAFGHSIAFGGSLAMSIAFIMSTRWPTWIRGMLIVLVGTAIALTFSRLGIIGIALTAVLMVLLLHRLVGRALSITTGVVLVIGAATALPILLQVFDDAGAEAEGSAEYRGNLLSLVDTMTILGVSPAREVLPTGQDYWGGFRSIDSALILMGLQFGLIPVAIVLVLLGVLVVGAIRAPSPAAVGLLAQVPAFATVALITQYSAFVWFLAGLAVAWPAAHRREMREVGGEPEQLMFPPLRRTPDLRPFARSVR